MLDAFGYALALGMLITGSVNTLSTKAADRECSKNLGGYTVDFDHPFVQALGMFVGEMLCLGAFHIMEYRARSTGDSEFQRAKPHPKYIFLLPALCDMTATSTMYVGLGLTTSSLFQMLRGSVVIFTALFSVVFLKRKLQRHHWVGVFLVILGTAIVGCSTILPACMADSCPSKDHSSGADSQAMTGNILIILAQIIVAFQMVVEEKFISKYDVPALQVVGWEGVWGFSALSIVLCIMYHIPKPDAFCSAQCSTDNGGCPPALPKNCDHFENPYDAVHQMGNNQLITLFVMLNIMSIAFFNFCGVSITKHVNAATRMVLDSLRTMVIWGFSLAIKWETFCFLQVIGFLVLLLGTLVYNGLVRVPGSNYDAETKPPMEANTLAVVHSDNTSGAGFAKTKTSAYGSTTDDQGAPLLNKAHSPSP